MADILKSFNFPCVKTAFTLAEVLITVMIIGIVAAITIPSLLENVNDRVFESQKKALFARLSSAVSNLTRISGYGTDDTSTAAQVFLTEGLSRYYKVDNICTDDLENCGLPATITTLDGNSISLPTKISELGNGLTGTKSDPTGSGDTITLYDTDAVAFTTANGESIALYYNPWCKGQDNGEDVYVQTMVCANFLYDLNGSEGPNKMGKDVGFITVLYRKHPVVAAPVPYYNSSSISVSSSSTEAIETVCTDIDEDLKLPNKDELGAMFYNNNLLNLDDVYLSSSFSTNKGSISSYTIQQFDENGVRMGVGVGSGSVSVVCVWR